MDSNLYAKLRQEINFSRNLFELMKFYCQEALIVVLVTLLLIEDNAFGFLAIPLIGTVMFRNFSLMHEAVHGNISDSKKTNTFFGVVCGTFCCLPYTAWKSIHIEHHKWVGNVEKDPSLAIVKNYPNTEAKLKNLYNFCWKWRIPFGGFMQNVVFWSAAAKYLKANPKTLSSVLGFAVPVIFWSSLILSLSPIQVMILMGGFAFYLFLVEEINFPHHVGLYSPQTTKEKLHPMDQHLVSRTCRYSPWFERYVILNFNFHSEHHLYLSLPWHQLENLHQKLLSSNVALNIVTSEWLSNQQKKSFNDFLFNEKTTEPEKRTA